MKSVNQDTMHLNYIWKTAYNVTRGISIMTMDLRIVRLVALEALQMKWEA